MSLKDYLIKKPVLETERLILRELRPEDTDDLREWLSDPGLYLYWGKRPGRHDLNPELLFTAANRKPTKSFHWGIASKKDNKVIGEFWVYLIENDRMAKVSYRLSPACQGNGLMTEALKSVVNFCFTRTELQRLWTDVDVRNTASCKTLEKAGFTREGCIRQGKMVSSWCDYYLYGMLKTDLLPEHASQA